MRYTLLELVQRILEATDGDEVNTIADNTEALAAANIIKEAYFEIVSGIDLKITDDLFHLNASGDNLKPCIMFVPDDVVKFKKLKYNIGPTIEDINLRELQYFDIDDFQNQFNNLDPAETWVGTQTVTLSGEDFIFKYRNDVSPSFWTSTDDRTIIFDAYDSGYENTLTSSRTYGYGQKVPVFQMVDNFIPQLDPGQFQLLLNSAKATAFVEMKQTENPRAERKERFHRALGYKTKDATDPRTAIQKHKGYGRNTSRWR